MEANRWASLARGLLTLLALGLLATACFGGGDEGDAEGPPSTPGAEATAEPSGASTAEEALQVFVERMLNRFFSGACADAKRPQDIGKVCYSLRGQRVNMRAYDLGPTFSEPTMLAILREEPRGWVFVTVENVDPTAPTAAGIPWPIELGERLIVVGTGLAGAGAASALGELGYNVKAFTFHDSPRRAHSVAAQGGVNAAKNYQNDGDNVYRMFYDTIKGGDFRSREANVYRMAELSVQLIDTCVAQGVPFAREYGGVLGKSTFPARGAVLLAEVGFWRTTGASCRPLAAWAGWTSRRPSGPRSSPTRGSH